MSRPKSPDLVSRTGSASIAAGTLAVIAGLSFHLTALFFAGVALLGTGLGLCTVAFAALLAGWAKSGGYVCWIWQLRGRLHHVHYPLAGIVKCRNSVGVHWR